MTELEFSQKVISLVPGIITGRINENELSDLYSTHMSEDVFPLIDFLLDGRNANKQAIEIYSKVFAENKKQLEQAAIEIDYSGIKRTRQEWIDYEVWNKKNCRDPLRWRVPGWIRIPVTNFFKKRFAIKK
jgi:hypothetical protein